MATQEITATISTAVPGGATATLRNTYTTNLTNDSLTVSGTLSLIIDGDVAVGVGAVAQLSDSSVSVFGSQLIATGEKTVSTSKNTSAGYVPVHAELTLGTYSKVITRTHSSQSVVVSMTSSALRAAVVWTGSAVSDPVSQTKSDTISLAARPSYTISYNANGGSSTPASQTKWYNEPITLRPAITRDKYLFGGWKWNNTGTAVAAGSSWNAANATGTFYAAWEYKYQSPSITRVTAWRTGTTASGGVYPKQDDGTNADIQVVLTAGKEKATAGGAYSVANTTVKFYYKLNTASSYTLLSTQTLSSATGTLTAHISSTLDIDKQYDVKVEAYITASTTDSTSFTSFISTAFFLVDMTQNGVAFGRAAESDKFMCALPTTIQNTLTVTPATDKTVTIDSSGNLNIPSGAKFKINSTNLAASDVGAVPTSRKVNNNALSSDITLTASDVSALSTSDKYTRSSTGALDWSSQADGDSKVIMKSALAWWNGMYNGSGSNLSRCTQGQIIGRNQICYANSRVDTFSSGKVTIAHTSLGVTTGAKPVGILLTPEYGGAVMMKYNYDSSTNTNSIIECYNADGSAYNGAMRYFAVVFQNTWTSV